MKPLGGYALNFRRLGLIVLMFACALACGMVAYEYSPLFSGQEEDGSRTGRKQPVPISGTMKAHLYFTDQNHQVLRAEERVLGRPDTAAGRARALIQALIEGPKSELVPTLPPKTQLLALYVTPDGAAYVDLDGTIRDEHPGGTWSELLSIFAMVNTLALNLEDVEKVKILIEGREAETMAGHIDIRLPFQPNIMMIQ